MILDTQHIMLSILSKKKLCIFLLCLKLTLSEYMYKKRRHGCDVEMEGVIAQESCRYRIKAVCRRNKFVAWRVQKQDK